MAIRIALAGNPNSGKTTLFNDLTGADQYVGNWPGVTVEKKDGVLAGHKDVIIQDLPGIYSLSPYSLEEVVSRNYLVNEKPDAILNIIDGSNLERNLYLTTQLLELGLPMVVAVNMIDVVRKNGDRLDAAKLSKMSSRYRRLREKAPRRPRPWRSRRRRRASRKSVRTSSLGRWSTRWRTSRSPCTVPWRTPRAAGRLSRCSSATRRRSRP